MPHQYLTANWPAPAHIGALTTTRIGGVSLAPYHENNVGLHVGDNPAHVTANRQALIKTLSLPNEPVWLEQTHSNDCITVEEEENRTADAAVTRQKKQVLAIMTADCLPILLCNQEGNEIAALHAGWRGLAHGIIEKTVMKMQSHNKTIMAWIGPGICGQCYRTGEEVQHTYLHRYPFLTSHFYHKENHLYADLPKIADSILKKIGITSVYHANTCTLEEKDRFYSYRHSNETGRMVSLIWFKDNKI